MPNLSHWSVARKLLSAGVDPGEHRKAEKAAGVERAANTFEVIARAWLDKRDWVESYSSKVLAWMENDVFPWIGGRPIADLSAPDYGDAVEVMPDELPVFWACGVTPQAAIRQARPAFCITHAPGAMLITDLLNTQLASF